MKLNIEIELSKEQLKQLKKTGKLSIKIPLDKAPLVQNEIAENQWPDAKGNGKAKYLIEKAKYFGLYPSELPLLSRSRVAKLLEFKDQWGEEIQEVEECLNIMFIDVGFGTLKDVFGGRIAYGLNKTYGVKTMTDLKTLTMKDVSKTSGIGHMTLQKFEEKLKSMHIEIPQV